MSSRPTRGCAYLIGGGIASLAAAVFLVRDAGFDGPRVRILEELPVAGGALDGSGDAEGGYVTRGARMFEEPSPPRPRTIVRSPTRKWRSRCSRWLSGDYGDPLILHYINNWSPCAAA
jgi:glycine/D-amino acid oxidase-like deaminating enzyme